MIRNLGNPDPAATKVLIVDDDEKNLLAFQATLKSLDCALLCTLSASEAQTIIDTQDLALILLDVRMPGKSGFELAEQVHKSAINRATPIIFISGDTSDQTIHKAYESGAVDYLTKPVDSVILKRKVETFVSSHRERTNRSDFELYDFFMQTPAPIVVLTGAEHRYTLVNPPYERMVARKVLGKTVLEAFTEEEVGNFIPLLDKVYRTGESHIGVELPLTIPNEKGVLELRILNVGYHPFKDRSGTIKGVFAIHEDVTSQVKARKVLEESKLEIEQERQNFRNLFKQTPEMVCILRGPEHVFEFVNEAHIKVLGFDATGKSVRVAQPESVEVHGILDDVYRTGVTAELHEIPVTLADRLRYFNLTYAARYDLAGKIIGIMILGVEVTDQVESRRTLQESQQKYLLLFEYSPIPKWIIDRKTTQIIDVNLAAVAHYGYTKAEFLNLYAKDLRPESDKAYFLDTLTRDFSNFGQGNTNRSRHQKKDGTIIEVEVTALDIVLDGRECRIGAIVDITDKVRAQAELEQRNRDLLTAKEEADKANHLKSAFLANMSHEIRTPLGAMIGFADLLRDPGLSSIERSNYIDILSRNGQSLAVIINDILDLSKVEAGHLTLEFGDTNPEQVAADVVSLLRVKAKEKDLSLILQTDLSLPPMLVTDAVRLKQILMNLVGNAIKFTQFGSITIRLFGCKTDSGKDAACFEISDTGIGIPENQRERVFEMFVQADGSMARRFGGTGLGLALSRRLARALGGDVEITRTVEGKGTTFLVKVEDQPERQNTESTLVREERHRAEPAPDALAGVKILVVDDSPDNQQLIWHYLTKRGALVETADNGLVGYRRALVGDYDIVLMDIQMPEMDGYTATQKLRDAGFRKPIVALTAHVLSDVRERCLNVGCTGHLAKPINPKLLVATVAELVGSKKQ